MATKIAFLVRFLLPLEFEEKASTFLDLLR